MDHAGKRIFDAVCETLERFPRVTGLVLGVALHPFFSALLSGR